MKLRALFLLLMIGYDVSLHVVELINKIAIHPLYPHFPLFGFISYELFWVVYWGFGFIVMLTLLGSGVTIKHKTEIHNHPVEKKFKTWVGKDITRDTPIIILDDNELSMAMYAEEFPENWKKICDSLDKEEKEESNYQSSGCGKLILTSRIGKDDEIDCGECRHYVECENYGEKEKLDSCDIDCKILLCDDCKKKQEDEE